jgi:hypothetical protein
MGRACSTCGERRFACKFVIGEGEKRRPLEDPSVTGRIILKRFFQNRNGDIYWIVLALDRDRCQALVNAVMNLRVL